MTYGTWVKSCPQFIFVWPELRMVSSILKFCKTKQQKKEETNSTETIYGPRSLKYVHSLALHKEEFTLLW